MPKTSLPEFLHQFADMLNEVERVGPDGFVRDYGRQRDLDKWWELLDLDVQPKTRAALDAAWKTWQAKNHPDKGVCSTSRFNHTKDVYLRERERLPETSATG